MSFAQLLCYPAEATRDPPNPWPRSGMLMT